MSRRYLAPLAAVATLLVALVATGCGVPGQTDVVVDGEGSKPYLARGYAEGPPPGPDGTSNNVDEFVKRFLEQPAGDWEGAAARVKRFLSPDARESWQAPKEVTVVRLVNGRPEIKSGPSYEVVLKVQQIGVLTNKGTLEPPDSQADVDTYTFTVGTSTAPGGGFQVLNPPAVMLLTDTALNRYFEQRTLYFWDTNHNLVPDLRYLPKTVDNAGAARPIQLIDWLIGGPSGWLRAGVTELPDGTKQRRNAYIDNSGRLIVDLNNAASGQSLDDLLAQLCWSLRDDFTGNVVLEIESVQQREGSSSDHLDSNPAYRLVSQGEQQFAVASGAAGGVVRRVQTAGAPVSADVPLNPAVNKNVRFAAISDGFAALVRHDGGQLTLWAGSTRPQRVSRTGLQAPVMSRPVLARGQVTGYVAAAGKLYQFNADSGKVSPVAVPGLSAGVTAVALAPDGRRLAVVAGGKPYLVALIGDGAGSTGSPRLVPSPLGGLTGISWLNETSLVVTGANRGKAALARVSLDGAEVTGGLLELNASAVTELVSFPENPVSGSGGHIMVEQDGKTYEVYSSSIDYLPPEKLAGPPAKGAVLVAPFFLE